MRHPTTPRTAAGLSALLALSLTLTACGEQDGGSRGQRPAAKAPAATVPDPLVASYDGGLLVLRGDTLKVAADLPLPGFLRVNPAGDGRHVLVSEADGFRALDAAAPALTGIRFPAADPGHVVHHAGRTALFADGSGEVTLFDPAALRDLPAGEKKPPTDTYRAARPHHGVAVTLPGGELVSTLGTEEERTGIELLDKDRAVIARSDKCPGVHGEATARGGAVVVGCEDGALVVRDGRITKVDSPTPYGRIGNQAGSEHSTVVLGDYKQDPDAELERPEKVSLIDTATGRLTLVDLGTSYTFRSLGRGPHGEALVLGTDGALHLIYPGTGKVTRRVPVLDPWSEPLDWQRPRPSLFVRDHTAYITDPAGKRLHTVDLESAERGTPVRLPHIPNELTGV
ncbi:hypothetical protein GT204_17005 [Streptomyces sp. SID4919]|uniref:zinc metallochaperone AztD n=1 Tax=unclassified Streptomyces TaxID=2593676 RepID=UPI000823B2D4|nr:MULTISPECIES: zinc metallochaperone AztD [unclassified Streptomyces]MYY10560.1 hypothetical protein [Streptomyces sp. SID4919]SCK47444.1 hypothetical protein YW7DRAFT_04240 [Streptomyces sp. AmelKG-E11A]